MLLGLALLVCPLAAAPPNRAVVQSLAPTGSLRVALYAGSPVTFVRGDTPDASKGVGLALGRELARSLGVPLQLVVYPTPAAVMEGLKTGEWDVTVLAQTPERERQMNMTAPFLLIEHGYLVPAGSPITAIAEVDRAGVRIGAPQGGSVNMVLAQTIKIAAVVPIAGLAAAPEALKLGQVQVFAANKANLFEVSTKLPGSHILDGRIGLDQYSIALPKGREAAMPFVRQFVDNARSAGLLRAAIENVGLRGAVDR
jgi:polar amino acid transport system substrate-binding protein